MQAKEKLVKDALSGFLRQYASEESLSIDDVVLSYMISILEDLGSGDSSDEVFDIEQFTEMMDAYLPGFQSFNSVTVSEWMFELASTLACQQQFSASDKVCESTASSSPLVAASLPIQTISEQSSPAIVSCDQKTEFEDGIDVLVKMFPDVTLGNIKRALSSAAGHLDLAVDSLLECEQRSANKKTSKATCQGKDVDEACDAVGSKDLAINDISLKKSILEKYSYVDTDEDTKNHIPSVKLKDQKKLIRYLDGRVVSVKGEKFTEIKQPEDEAMKSTYINLKPARQYRFH